MRVVILFTLLAAAYALPTPERAILTRDQLDSKARDVEAFITLVDQIKNIALAPRDNDDWVHPDSDVRDIEAFLAIIDILKNIAITTDSDWQLGSQECDVEDILDILDHLKNWVLATGADMNQLDIQGPDKEAYLSVLYLIEDVERYVSDEARDREAFLTVLDWFRNMSLTTGGEWEQQDGQELDKEAFQAVLYVLREIENFSG